MKGLWLPFLLFCELSGAQAVLRVRPHVVVAPNTEVKLAQLIDQQDVPEAVAEKLKQITLTKAPAYGDRQELAQASLMEVLRPIVQEERDRNGSALRLILPKQVVIDTLKRELKTESVTSELLEAWKPLCRNCKLEIEGLSLPAIQGVRDWTLKVKSELPRGSFSIPVDIIRMDQAPVQAWITGRLIVRKKVPVAKRVMAPGDRVQANDFEWTYRDTSFALDGVPAEDELIGRKLRQGLRAGDVIWAANMEKEKAVRRGDLVQVKSGEGAWEVSVTAVAQQDAMIGDVINLKHPKTNNILVGQVVRPGEVVLK